MRAVDLCSLFLYDKYKTMSIDPSFFVAGLDIVPRTNLIDLDCAKKSFITIKLFLPFQ